VKKLAAILFFAIVVFNLCGYHVVIDFFQNKQENQLKAQLDNDKYNDKDLVFIKIPIRLPYYSNSKEYEKVNGSITFEGVEYRYIKRRVYNDTIELACILNTQKQQFQSAREDYLKLNTDWLNTHSNKKTTTNIKIVPLEFCNKITHYIVPEIRQVAIALHEKNSILIPLDFHTVQEQPPDGSVI
jgi:hypothetical protein